jgi:Probable molybdopterin binding domain
MAALLVIGGKIPIRPHQGPEHRLHRRISEAIGIDLKEVRVVGDEEAIIDALNALRHRYTYVFTTGGIGPTHGDITADCVAVRRSTPIRARSPSCTNGWRRAALCPSTVGWVCRLRVERAWHRQDYFVLTACRITRMRSVPDSASLSHPYDRASDARWSFCDCSESSRTSRLRDQSARSHWLPTLRATPCRRDRPTRRRCAASRLEASSASNSCRSGRRRDATGVPLADPQPAFRIRPHAARALIPGRRLINGRRAVLQIDIGKITTGQPYEPDVAFGRAGDPIGPAALGCVPDLHIACRRVEPAIDAILSREPDATRRHMIRFSYSESRWQLRRLGSRVFAGWANFDMQAFARSWHRET